MSNPLFKEYIELTDGSLVWSRGKTIRLEVSPIGPTINELKMNLDGKYVGMDVEEAEYFFEMFGRALSILRNNPKV